MDTAKAKALDTSRNDGSFHGILSVCEGMKDVFRYVEAIAGSSHPVLLTGETGVGKELLANAIHAISGREGRFVAVNVAGLEETLFADALFGHRKGAYTGADCERSGLVAQASGGTLLLDEIGDIEPCSQVKLLRLLEENEYYPLGSDHPESMDARIVCATHHDLTALVREGKFRSDLFYRLRAHHIHVPPLRERRDDFPVLIDQFMEEAARSLGKVKPASPPELLGLLGAYHFPGNVRELRSMIFDAVACHRSGVLSLGHFRDTIGKDRRRGGRPADPDRSSSPKCVPFEIPARFPTLEEAEEHLVAEALKRSGNNQGIAADLLGCTRQALSKRLARRMR